MVDADRTVFTGRIVTLRLERVTLPNGQQSELEVVHHPGGVAVVATDAQDRICLLRQYRHVAGGWLWELPAGKIEQGEALEVTACRELLEETGVTASNWSQLGKTITSPGIFTEVVHLFCASDLSFGEHGHEDEEVIEVHWFDYDEIEKMIISGEIYDAKTVIGINLFRLLHRS